MGGNPPACVGLELIGHEDCGRFWPNWGCPRRFQTSPLPPYRPLHGFPVLVPAGSRVFRLAFGMGPAPRNDPTERMASWKSGRSDAHGPVLASAIVRPLESARGVNRMQSHLQPSKIASTP